MSYTCKCVLCIMCKNIYQLSVLIVYTFSLKCRQACACTDKVKVRKTNYALYFRSNFHINQNPKWHAWKEVQLLGWVVNKCPFSLIAWNHSTVDSGHGLRLQKLYLYTWFWYPPTAVSCVQILRMLKMVSII